MNRFLKSIILDHFWCFIGCARPPNIAFLVDDLGWSDVGCYGSTFHETPHIDQLAKEGMRFDKLHSYLSRLFAQSGQYPYRKISGSTDLTEWLGGRPERILKNCTVPRS